MTTTTPPRYRIYFEALPVYHHDDPLVRAANAGPSWRVQFKPADDPGAAPVACDLWHPMDLSWPDFFKLQAIEQDTSGAMLLSGVPDKLRLLMPGLPEDVLSALTANQIVSLATKAWHVPGETAAPEGEATNPPGGERASDTSSRSPHGSTHGAMAS